MKVVYITYPWFLDFALEYIKALSKKVELHVIVISQKSKRSSTIFDLSKDFSITPGVFYSSRDFGDSLKDSRFYEEYIGYCKSFSFCFTPNKWIGSNNLVFNLKLKNYIKKISPDVVHFDDLSIELFWQRFFLKRYPFTINVHDPVAHSGEKNKRRDIIRKIMYPKAKKFITFSHYSSKLFLDNYGYHSETLSLVPYTFYRKYAEKTSSKDNDYVLFFGRVSSYKGIEDLLKAYKILKAEGFSYNLVIAGKEVYNYEVPQELISTEGVIYLNRFIPNAELAELVNNSKYVICPYRDATQSGVVMTALALNKKVIVSRVGGLYEPISSGNGLIFEMGNTEELVEKMKQLLVSSNDGENNVIDKFLPDYNVEKLVALYTKINDEK